MMVKAKGPVWHQKQKKHGIIPKGLTGLDKEATWGKSQAEGWVYGHGTFSLTSHRVPLVGLFHWMPNAGHEAKRMEAEIIRYPGRITKVCMDSKADDHKLYFRLKKDHHIQLITTPRTGMDKSPARQQMIQEMQSKQNQRDYQKRSTTVEPMQGLVADIFDLDRCWMRGDRNNRWLFAAMGIAVQIAQWDAFKHRRSTWAVKAAVLGV
jgi:hypothetical protein